jgi:hypothetical protein
MKDRGTFYKGLTVLASLSLVACGGGGNGGGVDNSKKVQDTLAKPNNSQSAPPPTATLSLPSNAEYQKLKGRYMDQGKCPPKEVIEKYGTWDPVVNGVHCNK